MTVTNRNADGKTDTKQDIAYAPFEGLNWDQHRRRLNFLPPRTRARRSVSVENGLEKQQQQQQEQTNKQQQWGAAYTLSS